ncbi:MAG: hypothetical protein QM800_08125 [Paludibacter sp.]
MKKKLLSISMFVAAALFCGTGAKAQTLLYSNDFESGLNGATIVGNGVVEASGNASHGQVFHNDPTVTNAVRTNYLLLPNTIFSSLKSGGTNAVTISFWVNKATATNYYWGAIFSAYSVAPSPNNGTPMFTLFDRGWAQMNDGKGNWCDFPDAQNAAGTNFAGTTWLDDANWHFYVAALTPTSAKIYVDGVIKNAWNLNGSAAGGSAAGIFTNGDLYTYITLGGNQAWGWGDPDPAFQFDKIKIYDAQLTTAQINSLMTTDQLASPVLTSSKSSVSLDDRYTSETIVVNGANLAEDITITAPAGITVNPTTISKTSATDVNVAVSFDGTTITTGNIVLTSGTLTQNVAIKTSSNAGCFTPLYASGNLITDPYCNSLSTYAGWGGRSVETSYVYCGSRSLKISGKCGASVDYGLSGKIAGGKTYRVKAMVSTNGTGEVKVGLSGATASNIVNTISTAAGQWLPIDFTFTAQASPSNPNMYFNSCETQTATEGYIDNWEMYEVPTVTAVNIVGLVNQNVYVQNQYIVTEFSLTSGNKVEFNVYNAQGMLVLKQVGLYNEGTNRVVLNSNFTTGVYVVKTKIDGKFTVNKVIL